MFKKKICKRCSSVLKSKYNFCPYCGTALDKKEEDFGMLGKDDSFSNNLNNLRLPGGFNLILNSLIKNLEKQFKDAEKKEDKPKGVGNISISISTFGNNPPVIKMNPTTSGNMDKDKKSRFAKLPIGDLPSEKLKKFSKLPKEEPKTSIRRLSNRVIYEVELPGVRSLKDISILNLERGLELKAVSGTKAYQKSIPITLPVVSYKLSDGKFSLELDAGN